MAGVLLPQPTKCVHPFSPQHKRTPLPCLSCMIIGSDVWMTKGLKSPHHDRLKKVFSISSQVLHKFILSAVTSHHTPHVVFPSQYDLVYLFCSFFGILFPCWPYGSQLPGPIQQQAGCNSWKKVLLKHPHQD